MLKKLITYSFEDIFVFSHLRVDTIEINLMEIQKRQKKLEQ